MVETRELTFEDACKIDLRLGVLLYTIEHVKDDKSEPFFCASRLWYGVFKPVMCDIVGWDAEDKRLSSSRVYDVCYKKLHGALPDCRHKSPFC